MCGRYALHTNPDVVALLFGLSEIPSFTPRYNIAPTSQVLIVRAGAAADSSPVSTHVRWGLIPRWAKDPSIGARMNNARAETVAQKPSFRDAYRRRRCLIPASGYYEWKPEGGLKQPYYFLPSSGDLFAFAGLWEKWNDLETCAIITTEANGTVRPVHDRMPVILAREDFAAWLRGAGDLLAPSPDSSLKVRKVSRAVNKAGNDSPELIDPVDP